MIIKEENYLAHYGVLRKSGRYPWGSGGPEHGGNKSFLDHVANLKRQGLSESEIAKGMGISTTQLRASRSIASSEERQAKINMAQKLKDKGLSNVAIGTRMGIPESSVRSLLQPGLKDRTDVLKTTAGMLRAQVAEKKYVDVGAGVENHLGISKDKLATAVDILRQEGYGYHYVKVPQLGTGFDTRMKVLSQKDIPYSEVFKNRSQIRQITDFSEDQGRSFLGIHDPISISSNRVDIRYKEQGGADADGVIYVRPGVKDLSLGAGRYAQVRVSVDKTHYLKGMAMYKDDLPDGVDLVFNTNKSTTGNKLDALKSLKDDPDNPFGAVVRQIVEKDSNGKEKVTSAMNIVNEEGNWDSWAKSLSAQTLSKQSPRLAQTQLDMTFERRQNELAEIKSLTNPTVRQTLLKSYAEDVDSAAVHLKAAALPRSSWHVILPFSSVKPGEIYAPNFKDGEKVALIRYPHGGTFEIPELTVNNKNKAAKSSIGSAKDAVGINHSVAERLSGADFDGDAVLVIPNGKGSIKTTPALEGLIGFDPKHSYPKYDGMKVMTASVKQQEMGKVSNLIADMTIHGATTQELARAVRHSMVVIDAEKHELDYKASARDNGISQLKQKYQEGANSGASTLITRAGSEIRVPQRKQGFRVDPTTGEKIFTETGKQFVGKNGNIVKPTTRSKKLAETTDAKTLLSSNGGTPMELIYAEHSNRLKTLANTARLDALNTKGTPYSKSAKAAYSNEVTRLNAALETAKKNAPLERQAQVLANETVSTKKAANPNMDAATLKKIKSQALDEARRRTGAGKDRIVISDREWDAIQAGAITHSKLSEILSNADAERVKELATPRVNLVMTSTKQARARQMLAAGYTQSQVADQLGVALGTLKSSIAKGDA